MDKRAFIQHVMIRSLPAREKIASGIQYAEYLWDRLTEAGYGGGKQAGQPRRSVDYYAQLDNDQRTRFDRFWEAFSLKDGKQAAARRWLAINPDRELAETIIEAARLEAQAARPPGTVRKHAEGWLNEQRWTDRAPSESGKQTQRNIARLIELRSDLAGLEALYNLNQDDNIGQQINAKKREIASLEASRG